MKAKQRSSITEHTNALIEKHSFLKKWQRMVSLLAAAVVLCATYAMILPAIAMDEQNNESGNAVMSILKAPKAADPPIYYEIRMENGEKVIHLSSTPFEEENIYTNKPTKLPASTERNTIDRVVIDNKIILPANCDGFFMPYKKAVAFDGLTNVDTSNVTNMQGMFSYCKSITELDLSGFDTSRVGLFAEMFGRCDSLKELDLTSFNTAKAYIMNGMFSQCYALERVDLSSFDTKNVVDMYGLFNNCKSLQEVDLSSFNTSNVTDVGDLFSGCESIKKIDLSNFDTKKVKSFYAMFRWCHSLEELDISSFEMNDNPNISYFLDMKVNGTNEIRTSISKIKTPALVSNEIKIDLPLLMVNEDDRNQVFDLLPNQPLVTKSITIIPYEASILEDGSDSQLFFKKYLDGVLVNEPQKFDFGVFTENGEDTGIRIKNQAQGDIIAETAGLPAGRYYVQEMDGNDAIIYDRTKHYFTIVEESVSKEIVYPTTELVYIPISEDYLDTTKYDLVANAKTVTAYERGTNNPVMTMKAYCADKSKAIVRGTVATTPNSVYINPTEAQINTARGVVYRGPYEGNLPETIKCVLCGKPEIVQTELWNLLNYGREVDVSKADQLPGDLKWAIIQKPADNLQPLIVPLWTTVYRDTYDSVEGDTINRRYVKLESKDIEFRNETLPNNAVRISAKKTLDGRILRDGQFSFELKDIAGTTLQTKSNGSNGTISFDPIFYKTADYGKTYTYTVSEVIGTADGITYDETVYTVKVTIDSQGNATYKMYKDLPESVTDNQEYAANHFTSNGNNHCLSIDNKVAYCYNLDKDWPWTETPSNWTRWTSPNNNGLNEGYTKLENVSDQDLQQYSNGAIKDDVLRVIYNGFPYDKAGLKAKYNLTDDQFRAVTQVALWYYTEGAYSRVNDSMTDKERWDKTWMTINRGIGAFNNSFWQGADDATKEKMYKCMADLSGATVKYSMGTGSYANSYLYRGDTTSLQEPSGDLTLDLFIHPSNGANIDDEEKIQNILSVGTISPTGETITHEEVSEIVFKNIGTAEKGNLIITKTIEGDVTEDEAKGAITFKVTTPDGTETTYTLGNFTQNADGVYTLEFNDVAVGEYTVEETTKDIEGRIVTVTYTVNNGESTEGDNTTVSVTNGNTATVAFKNDYAALYVLPETGGIGTKGYAIGGLLLMGGALFLVYKNNLSAKRRGER